MNTAPINATEEQHERLAQNEYAKFLDDVSSDGKYTEKIKKMYDDDEHRLIVDLNDLRKRCPERVQNLLGKDLTFEEMRAIQHALFDVLTSLMGSKENREQLSILDYFVGFCGSLGSNHLTPRTLMSSHIGSLCCVEGIVTRCSMVKCKVVKSVHYCEKTKQVIEQRYKDITSYDTYTSNAYYPTKDEHGNLLETEYGLCKFKDHRTFSIQELPEKAPAGQMPRQVDVIADYDLVELCQPGNRVQIIGIYRCLPSKQNGYTSASFRTTLISNNIINVEKKNEDIQFSDEDTQHIKQYAKSNIDTFTELAESLAPSIYGHELIKKALLCMLVGGVEKRLDNGSRLRGDINIMLIGDPSVAKSQLLRFVMRVAPRAINTTGRGTTGVGLTAAVTQDHETGERRLEAGAMVLGDRGVVCIDEFDKMSDIDRTAVHEVMEQGRVSISKAGITAQLNARCSVLAAANPVYGRYDESKTPVENIGLQDSLLSRFDLIFILLDSVDRNNDSVLCDHVVRTHCYRSANQSDGQPEPFANIDSILCITAENEENEANSTQRTRRKNQWKLTDVYDQTKDFRSVRNKKKYLKFDFIRKYIQYAKRIEPTITKECASRLAEEYTEMRNNPNSINDVLNDGSTQHKTQPITARTMETLIRLSSAHAKCRLSNKVTEDDAEVAIQLVHFCHFKKVYKKRTKKDSLDKSPEALERNLRNNQSKREKRKQSNSIDQNVDEAAKRLKETNISSNKIIVGKKFLLKLFDDRNTQSLDMDIIREEIKKQDDLTEEEIMEIIDDMQKKDMMMIAENALFLV
ncbi:hypothetical protein SNEBB_003953 [Seison nebaliae]|nr:hypothetical protein SNEBB_003953 [Seison nebaliae]